MKVRLCVTNGKSNVKEVLLGDRTIIGRGPECNLKIASSQVSRRHCQLTIRDGKVLIRDLGSANGTLRNEQPVPTGEDVPVQPGDAIVVGPLKFVLKYEPAGPPASDNVADTLRAVSAAAPQDETVDFPATKRRLAALQALGPQGVLEQPPAVQPPAEAPAAVSPSSSETPDAVVVNELLTAPPAMTEAEAEEEIVFETVEFGPPVVEPVLAETIQVESAPDTPTIAATTPVEEPPIAAASPEPVEEPAIETNAAAFAFLTNEPAKVPEVAPVAAVLPPSNESPIPVVEAPAVAVKVEALVVAAAPATPAPVPAPAAEDDNPFAEFSFDAAPSGVGEAAFTIDAAVPAVVEPSAKRPSAKTEAPKAKPKKWSLFSLFKKGKKAAVEEPEASDEAEELTLPVADVAPSATVPESPEVPQESMFAAIAAPEPEEKPVAVPKTPKKAAAAKEPPIEVAAKASESPEEDLMAFFKSLDG